AVADRISKAGGARDQLLRGGIVVERALGHRAHQNFEQFGIGPRRRCLLAHCSVPPDSAPPFAVAISISIVSMRARSHNVGASSRPCFSATSKGQIIASELISTSAGARSIELQSASILCCLR